MPVNNVVIIGGGTAGWMTATRLQAAFGDRISITLVESGRVGTIGVGEATFSTIRHFFKAVGLAESDWMPACNATYKLAIRFDNWRGKGHTFYHPFERAVTVDGFTLTEWWLRDTPSERFDQDCYVIPVLCDSGRSPRYMDGSVFEATVRRTAPGPDRWNEGEGTQFPYAYHFDAALLAEFLMNLGTKRGVTRVVDDVLQCHQDEKGWITHLTTRDHGDLLGDLFVDCTGFLGLLIDRTLEEPFISYQNALPNDRAVALRVPVEQDRAIPPYTRATAMDAGWIWTIPLFDRNGMGYVYCSDYCTPEEAEQTLRTFAGPAAADLEANHIRLRIGRHRNSWVRNCVAIGLSSGFVEPLESTGIFFIQHGIEQLVSHFPDERWNLVLVDRYNQLVGRCLDGVFEFLTLHYRTAARADTPYWKATKERELPNGLADRLQLWRSGLPDSQSIYPYEHGFEAYSYVAMIMGLGGIPLLQRPALDLLDATAARQQWQEIKNEGRRLAEELPSHREYLAQYR